MKLTDWLLTLYCLVLCTAAACGTKPPTNELETVQYNGLIKVGTSAGTPPFEYLDKDGNISGFDIDLVQEIGKRMGVRIEIQDMPHAQLFPALRDGKIDIAIVALKSPGEDNVSVDFTDAYLNLEGGFGDGNHINRPGLPGGKLYIAVPEGAAELAKALNEIIADMAAEGFIEDLAQEYHLEGK